MGPICFTAGSTGPSSQLEDVNRVKLQACEPRLFRRKRTADQSGKAQLHFPVKLIEGVEAMLCDIRPLANIALIEVAHNVLALDVDARISDLQIPLFLQSANSPFRPVSAPLMPVTGC